MKYLAFDIETAKIIPGDDFNWQSHRPLGISCATTLASDSFELKQWFGKRANGSPAGRMERHDAKELVQYLARMAEEGYKILTWNGQHFDFDILQEESGSFSECKTRALNHIDMMFQAVCILGHRIALEKAAHGMGLPGKLSGMKGKEAPGLWAQGKYEKVLSYNAQDVRVTLQIAQKADRIGKLRWLKSNGMVGEMPLKSGWLSVHESLRLPKPDTPWRPIPREDFIGWSGKD